RSAARRADFWHPQRDRHRSAERRDAERDRDLGLDLLRLGFAGAAPAPEDGREDVSQAAEIRNVEVAAFLLGAPAAPTAAEPAASSPAGKRTVAAQLIVLLALVNVAQHVVRLIDLLEAVGGLRVVGVAVRMVLLREAPERLLDLVRGGGFGDSQHLIVVALCCHYCPCQVSTITRAGRSNVSRIR